MILADYFRSTPDASWDVAKQCGVKHAVIRLPEDEGFDLTSLAHWNDVYKRFTDFGVKPIILEPMPNELHDHIKIGDEKRDECIEKVIKMFPIMDKLDVRTICFNWLAYVGWHRTRADFPERGGAMVTAFDIDEYKPTADKITKEMLWKNYEYFLKAVIPEAEKHGIVLALHPDDPPLEKLGGIERIMISLPNIKHAIYDICPSDSLGITLCQATYKIMGADLEEVAKTFGEKIKFIHFRNTTGTPEHFRETYHDNGDIPMAKTMKMYKSYGIDVPVRVDHVPTMPGEVSKVAGYDALGRYFAIGYLKGILEAL